MESQRQEKYIRIAAVQYALKYALKPNPAYRYFPLIGDTSGDCANFLSQCLKAGGVPLNYNQKNPWWYNSKGTSTTKDDTWSLSWTIAHSLYWLLKINNQSNLSGAKGMELQTSSDLDLGDLVFFENYKRHIFHSAIVTSFDALGKPLISQHSFEAVNIPVSKSWGAVYIHYLKIRL